MYVPLTIVCGPPGSGKSTYVAAHKGERDIVFDLDAIALTRHGCRVSLLDKERMLECIKARNESMADLMWAKARGAYDRAWLIVAEPAGHKRQWWHDKLQPDSIVVLETPAATCVARCQSDDGPARSHDVADGIKAWWKKYTQRPGDVIISP